MKEDERGGGAEERRMGWRVGAGMICIPYPTGDKQFDNVTGPFPFSGFAFIWTLARSSSMPSIYLGLTNNTFVATLTENIYRYPTYPLSYLSNNLTIYPASQSATPSFLHSARSGACVQKAIERERGY